MVIDGITTDGLSGHAGLPSLSRGLNIPPTKTWTIDPEPNTISFATKIPVCLDEIGFPYQVTEYRSGPC